jgi:hypothetical protein
MLLMPIRGDCATRSSVMAGFSPCRSLGAPRAQRVNRGGSWNNEPRNLRSANRNRNSSGNRNNNNGFRVARTLHARTGGSTDPAAVPRGVQERP